MEGRRGERNFRKGILFRYWAWMSSFLWQLKKDKGSNEDSTSVDEMVLKWEGVFGKRTPE